MRIEHDALGTIGVPDDCYYGAQTARALEHFAIGRERMPLEIIHAYGVLKRAAAEVNAELGLLPGALAARIIHVADEISAGTLDAQFPLSVWQSGSGTQTHMNVNEVIANRASELAGEPRGSKRPVHPNDHANLGQSTNDTFPSALHIAAVLQLEHRLRPALHALIATLRAKSDTFSRVLKLGRTHLQDATPLTLGQEISGWVAQLEAADAAIATALPMLRELPLGGTAVGTGLNAHPAFGERAVQRIAELTGLAFTPMTNRFAGIAAHDACVRASGALRQLATACTKLANDVRWLASGPRAGLGELTIPPNEPGSSMMPGKVNPTQCEALAMVAMQVMGNDVVIGFAGSQGNFELNAYKPLIAFNVLSSIRLLADACKSFELHCARGIEPRFETLQRNVERSLMLVTALVPHIGYDRAAQLAAYAHQHDLAVREAALQLDLATSTQLDDWLAPEPMTLIGM